jgi:hypothetical protein
MTARHFDLVSHWRLQAPVEAVWAALVQPEQWPRWWPGLHAVRTLREGPPGGLGSVRRMVWNTGLPYRLHLSVQTVEVLHHERLRGRVRGTLQGDGLWLLRGRHGVTDVTYVWRVELATPWMRWLAPVLAPLFRWNHRRVMRAGAEGLAKHLRCPRANAPRGT